MSTLDEMRERARQTIRRNYKILNRLEPHLGCVICRGPLTDGACPINHQAEEPTNGE